MLLEGKIVSLEENASLLNSFEIIYYWTNISDKKTAKETSSVGLSLSESNRIRHEITYLPEECIIQNCIIQTLLENQKVIQNTVNTGRFDKNTKIHTESFIVPKTFAIEYQIIANQAYLNFK